MECTRLATTMEVSCREYPWQLARVVIATGTMAVTHPPALGAVQAVMATTSDRADMAPHPVVMAAVAIMDSHPLRMVVAAATGQYIQPPAVDPSCTNLSLFLASLDHWTPD
jgi:hypothetical protein